MCIAVAKGAKEGETFKSYIDFLSNGYIPPDAREWLDHVRMKGNEASHEISIILMEDAQLLMQLVEIVLKMVYEFTEMVRQKVAKMEDAGGVNV